MKRKLGAGDIADAVARRNRLESMMSIYHGMSKEGQVEVARAVFFNGKAWATPKNIFVPTAKFVGRGVVEMMEEVAEYLPLDKIGGTI